MRTTRLSSLVVAVVLTAAAGAVPMLAPAPAQAAACPGAGGVTVVVDYNELGDGVRTGCDADGGGRRAAEIFADAGFPLRYATSSPGFVCRVTEVPQSEPCIDAPPATAYWSLWLSDGTSGTWSYATRGVDSLIVPDGGYVAFAWHEGTGRASAPGVAPTPRLGSTTTKPDTETGSQPAAKPGSKPAAKPGSRPSAQGTSRPEPSATPTETPSAGPSPSELDSALAEASDTASTTVDPADPTATVDPDAPAIGEITAGPPADGVADGADREDGGLPIWLPIGAVVVVAVAGGAVAWRRRIA